MPEKDMRSADVVVSKSDRQFGGAVQYESRTERAR